MKSKQIKRMRVCGKKSANNWYDVVVTPFDFLFTEKISHTLKYEDNRIYQLEGRRRRDVYSIKYGVCVDVVQKLHLIYMEI